MEGKTQLWKPGDPKPSGPKSAKKSKDKKKDREPAPPATKSPAAKSPGISRETMKMKFMQRASRDDVAASGGDDSGPARSPTAANHATLSSPVLDASAVGDVTAAAPVSSGGDGNTTSTSVPSSDLGVSGDFKWRLPLKAKVVADAAALQCLPVEPNTKLHVLGRRSFGGFNIAVERAYEEVREDPSREKRTKRLEKHAVGDEEMANFYAQRVGAFQARGSGGAGKGNKSGGGGKGKGGSSGKGEKMPTSISGSGGGGNAKRKRR